MMGRRSWNLMTGVCLIGAGALSGALSGCSTSNNTATKDKLAPPVAEKAESPAATAPSSKAEQATAKGTAKPEDVKAAKARLAEFGSGAKFVENAGKLTEIAVQDGASVTADDLALFGKLTDLQKLQIYNCRALNDDMASHLLELKSLTALALTNSIISDATVVAIVKSFPNLIDLDLSSNTNMTNNVLKVIIELPKLQRLTLVQNRFNEINTRQLAKLPELRALDLRGNMEAGDMTLEVVSKLPKLTAFKHRSNAVSDNGMQYLSNAPALDSLLIQDFVITGQSGMHLANLKKMTQLEIFRCQGFGSDGVLALKGLPLQRLTLRDLPNVDDQALDLLTDLPKLKRLYLHELDSVSDDGLKKLASVQSLELLDVWSITRMSDATVDVIATLPNLKELGIRSTAITDASIDKLIAMPKLQSLTLKDNASITADGIKKLLTRKWTKLDTGSGSSDSE